MTLQEDLLRQTLLKVHDAIVPSPQLLDDIRAAVAQAERRRRVIAAAVIVAVVVTTVALLAVLLWIRTR
jgi:fatty acid desaturase